MGYLVNYGTNGIITLPLANGGAPINLLNLANAGGSNANTANTVYMAAGNTTTPITTSISSIGSNGALYIQGSTGTIWRKMQASGTTGAGVWEQLSPLPVLIAQSTAGYTVAAGAASPQYLSFPTTVALDAGLGTVVQPTAPGPTNAPGAAWRFVPARQGIYLVKVITEWANVPTSTNNALYQGMYTVTGGLTYIGSTFQANTGLTLNKTFVTNSIWVNSAVGSSTTRYLNIGIASMPAGVALTQTTTAATNRIVICYMGRYTSV